MPPPDSPATPRPAATVVLLRDGPAGLEVFLQHRVRAMAFAPNVHVFPGGGVDDRDRVNGIGWAGPPASWWAGRMGRPEELATAAVCAAVRETFEECGVLLAGPAPDDGASGPDGARPRPVEMAAARAELVDGRGSLADVLTARGWVLRADLLRPWANWITPEGRTRRYDTMFFVAGLPDGQRADADNSEVSSAGWRRPADALADWKADRIELLPPTWVTLEQLTEQPDVAAALGASDTRTITPLIPKVRREGDRLVVTLPGEPGYARAAGQLRPRPTAPDSGEDTVPAAGLLANRPSHPVYEKARPV
ncbi:MAG: hypothetical protein J2P19_30435, partial [Pseudonocardia sp.]|nr:hypothetical protein [Pseudonocardia sp.]